LGPFEPTAPTISASHDEKTRHDIKAKTTIMPVNRLLITESPLSIIINYDKQTFLIICACPKIVKLFKNPKTDD
jgi:hypothetical protein